MKKITFILLFALGTLSTYAQSYNMTIQGLEPSKKITKINVQGITYTTTNSTNTRNRTTGTSNGTAVYIIERLVDNHSPEIRNAVDSGKHFSKSVIHITENNGTKLRHILTNVYLSDYSAQNGTEQFTVHFQSESTSNN